MTGTTGRRLELYCRAETMGRAERRQSVIVEEARALAQADVVDEVVVYEVERTPAVGPEGPQDVRAMAAFEEFRTWADEHDTRLHPAFDTRECYSWEDGRRYTALVVPVVALAVYDAEELRGVYPHGRDPHMSVFDGLQAVERGGLPTPRPPAGDLVPAE
jgi:hypothetical protein